MSKLLVCDGCGNHDAVFMDVFIGVGYGNYAPPNLAFGTTGGDGDGVKQNICLRCLEKIKQLDPLGDWLKK